MLIYALRSTLSAAARRSSESVKGDAPRLNMALRLTFVGVSSQIASDVWLFRSFKTGICKKKGEVKSTLPAANAMTPVDGFLIIVYSMPSRYGCPFFQYSVFLATLIDSFCLNSTN